MEYGVPLEDLYLDPLVLQIATSQDHARHVIKAISMFQEMNDPPMKTVVGLSNISNGCPKALRPILNKYYFLLLADAGLTAAIADAHEMSEALNDRTQFSDVVAGKQIADAAKMAEMSKTLDVMMGRTLYAHSYLEM
jgi:5-methyltetrahydrofolate corrinoid/iron sulfur protein methyltransferase